METLIALPRPPSRAVIQWSTIDTNPVDHVNDEWAL